MTKKLLTIYNYFEKNLIVIVAALAVFVSPFVVDYTTLPEGYELPKVHFLVAISAVIIFLGVIKYIEKVYKTKKFVFSRDFIVFILLVIVFILSSLFSVHFITSIYGNSFRDQGLITHLTIIGMAYVVYKSINKTNFHLLALSFLLSALVQSGLGYVQTVNLIQTDPKSLLDGLWVNGTFGQANFFSGRLLVGLIFAAYYIGKNLRFRFGSLVRFLILLSSLFIVGALLLSLSIWAIITASAAFVIILVYEIISKKAFGYIFYAGTILSLIFGIVYLADNTTYNLRIEIWKQVINLVVLKPISQHTIFGFGFDTLGLTFIDNKLFPSVLIDRAHNFFFDILFQTGFAGLLLVLGILAKPLVFMRKQTTDRKFMFAFFALFFWLLRSFVHESGIVNMVDFLIVLAMTLALLKKDSKTKGPELLPEVDLKKASELEQVDGFEDTLFQPESPDLGLP